jgi:hypothetical protein
MLPLPTPLVPVLAVTAAVAVAAATATAATSAYSVRTLADPAGTGLAVSGPLDEFVAGSKARVIVPDAWAARRGATPGTLRYRATQNSSCRYDITYAVSTVLGPAQDAAARVAAELPPASSPYLIDGGARGKGAFRVIRVKTTSGRVRLSGLWAGVLTKRDDVAPGGQTAWTEIRVTATAVAGDECHSGTYRSALGPTLGDSLAVARTALHFTKG